MEEDLRIFLYKQVGGFGRRVHPREADLPLPDGMLVNLSRLITSGYVSLLDSRLGLDVARFTDSWRNQGPRHDYVIVETELEAYAAQLLKQPLTVLYPLRLLVLVTNNRENNLCIIEGSPIMTTARAHCLGSHVEIGAVKNSSNSKQQLFFPSDLPPAESIIFKDSSFFRHGSALPSPADVVAEARHRGLETDLHPPPVHYPLLGLTVKYGRTVSTAEGQCLWALRRLPGDPVPVPEVYGWTVEAGISYIYMEYIPGETLRDRWDSLSESEKRDICGQLRTIVTRFRALRPHGDAFIGTISRQPLLDYAFTTSSAPPMGPFTSAAEFHDLFVKLPFPDRYGPGDPLDPLRVHLPDDVPIVFTHADLHRGNIIVSSSTEGGRPQIKALIDWGQSGWYPSYWEYCKAQWTGNPAQEWRTTYTPMFLDRFD